MEPEFTFRNTSFKHGLEKADAVGVKLKIPFKAAEKHK
jgi:hypothetical protein